MMRFETAIYIAVLLTVITREIRSYISFRPRLAQRPAFFSSKYGGREIEIHMAADAEMNGSDDPRLDEYGNYIDPNLDMFGERTDVDEEYLTALRYNKTIANDRWQSNIFREANCGHWKGVYDVYIAKVDGEEMSLGKCTGGIVVTETRSTAQLYEGVDITSKESYEPSASAPPLPTDSDSTHLLVKCTKDLIGPRSFRPVAGNQIVAESYTICSSISTDLDLFVTCQVPDSIVKELAIKEGPYRTRVRYLYTKSPTLSLSAGELMSGQYDMSLVGFTVIREQKVSNETEPLASLENFLPLPIQETVEVDMDDFYKSDYFESVRALKGTTGGIVMGTTLYDPQESGEPYVELPLPGKLTLFFPRGLIVNKQTVITMQWEGVDMRYQLDRKFTSLGNVPTPEAVADFKAGVDTYLSRRAAATSDSITSLELTEIRNDLSQEYPALFNPSPELLK